MNMPRDSVSQAVILSIYLQFKNRMLNNQEACTECANLLLYDTGQRLRPPESQSLKTPLQANAVQRHQKIRPQQQRAHSQPSRLMFSMLASALLIYISSVISEDTRPLEMKPQTVVRENYFKEQSSTSPPIIASDTLLDDDADEQNRMFRRLKKRGFFFAAAQAHPTPSILSFSRSADCNTYTFSWTYNNFPVNNYSPIVTFQMASASWSYYSIYNSVNYNSYRSYSMTYSQLVNSPYYYYLSRQVSARYQVYSYGGNYYNSWSSFYAASSDADFIKTRPGTMTDAPTMVQTTAQLTFSWPSLPSTWSHSGSNFGTGNDNVYYALWYAYYSWAELTTQSYSTLSFTVAMPDSRFNYGWTYQFQIRPRNSCGESQYSQPSRSYLIQSYAPTGMNTPRLELCTGNIISLSWSQPTDQVMGYRTVSSYQLYYCLSSNCYWSLLMDQLVTSYIQTSGYAWSSTYLYKLKAVNAHGAGADSGILSVATPTVPAQVTGLTCTQVTRYYMVFSWTALSTSDADTGRHPITHYNLRYKLTTQSDAYWVSATGSSGFTSSSFTQTSGFSTSTQYHYQVRAENRPGGGLYSPSITVTTATVPVKVANPVSVSIAPTEIVTSWTRLTTILESGNDPIIEYKLEKSTSPSSGFVTACTTDSSASGCSEIATMPSGVTYYYRLVARNSIGYGTYSDNLVITTDAYPGASQVTLTQGAVEPYSMTISWTALPEAYHGNDPVIFYAVELYNTATSQWTQLNSNFGNIYLTYTHTSETVFVASTYYQFRIRPKNGVGYSLSTSPVLSVLADGYPNYMHTPTVGTITPKSIVIYWDDLLDLTKNGDDYPTYYRLEWYNQITNPSVPVWTEITSEADGKVFTFTHTRTDVFPSGSTQKYRVKAKNRVGLGTVYSSELSVTADNVPIRMNNPTRNSVSPNEISIDWTGISAEVDTGRDSVVYYHVKWEQTSNVWTYLTNWPTTTTMLFKFTHTLSGTNVFPSGSTQNYKVCAENGVGEGACGSVGIVADYVPQEAPVPTVISTDITPTSIYLTWNEISAANNGGDSVIYHSLEWDQGTNKANWAELTTYSSGMAINTFYTHNMPSIFPTGQTNYYRVSAKNGVGLGSPCTPVAVLCDEVPIYMYAPTNVSVTYNTIEMNWQIFSDSTYIGRDPVIYYELEWFNRPCYSDSNIACTTTYSEPSDGTWVELTSYDDVPNRLGTSKTHYTATYWPANKDFEYRMRAKNGVGTGAASAITLVRTDDVPMQMAAPSLVRVRYNEVDLSWSEVTGYQEQGRDLITSYQIWWDQGTGNWVKLTSDSVQLLQTTYKHQLTAPFLPVNQNVYYKISATNRIGVGSLSPALAVLTPDVPQQMVAPALVRVRYNEVRLSWDLVTDFDESGRDVINSYQVWWDKGLNDWVQLTTDSDQLLQTTYTHSISNPTLPINQNVYYKIGATNMPGVGPLSPALAVLTPDVPKFMNRPTVTSIVSNEIILEWVPLDNSTQWEEQGREEIFYYTIECDPATVDGTFTPLNPTGAMVTTFTQTSVSGPYPPNKDYRYRVRARNMQGDGIYSDILTIQTDDVPIQGRNLALVSILPKQIVVSWDEFYVDADTGRDPIIYYRLEYNDNSPSAYWQELTSDTNSPVIFLTHFLPNPFPANHDQSNYYVSYRVTAINSVGEGQTSTNLDVLTETYPKKMAKVTIDDPESHRIKINWVKLSEDDVDTGRDPVIHYNVLWNKVEDPLTETWVTLSTYPNLDSTLTVTSGYDMNTIYRIKIAAQNGVGIAIYSDPEEVLTDNVPVRMNTPTEDVSTNATYIKVNWEPISLPIDTGRDDVIYYKLEWDQGSGIWADAGIPTDQMRTSWTFNTDNDGVQNGTTYQFRVTPKNRVGFGVTSAALSVIPSSPPDTMNTVRVSLRDDDTAVFIDWDYPQDNGDSVDEYLIEIKDITGSYLTYLPYCNGADPTIAANRQCFVQMAVLRASPFSLPKEDQIVVRAMAKNLKGFNDSYSDTTLTSFTTVIEIEPDAPEAPFKGADTKYNVLHTYWNTITDYTLPSGGLTAAILSYNLQRNEGNNTDPDNATDVWVDINGLSELSLVNDFQTSLDIIGGTTYKVRVRALNKHGWGPWSPDFFIRCARAPDTASWITTANSTFDFLISWHLPFNGGLQIERYYIRIMKKGSAAQMLDNNNWYEELDHCDGANPTVNASQSCLVPMQVLRNDPFYYGLNDKIRIRIWVENIEGIGEYKDLALSQPGNDAMIQTEPSAPSVPIYNFVTTTTDLQIKISWTPHNTSNQQGGYAVHSYEIQWSDGEFDWETLYIDESQPFTAVLLYTKIADDDLSVPTQKIVPGTQYKFRYRAINIHGVSSWSAETPIYASTKPDKMNAPSTSLYNQTVTITWGQTPNDHALPVTKYAIRFRTKAGSYIEDTNCNGQASSTIVTSRSCVMAMTRFTSSTYNLQIDDLIQVTLEAYNIMGWSGQSSPNVIGVTAKKNPQKVVSNVARGPNTAKTAIHITWTGISANVDTGGQPVDYKIQYDKASGGTTWVQLIGTTSNITSYFENSSNFKMGYFYQFKIVPWNDFGNGQFWSNAFGIWTAVTPSGLAPPTTTLNYVSYVEEDDIVVIDWDVPTDPGGLTTWYSLEIRAKSMSWIAVNSNTECYELSQTTNYKLPFFTAADAVTRCSVLVSNLKSKYLLEVGDTVVARITATHQVGSVTSDGGGNAVLPPIPCFRTTYPRVFAGVHGDTAITAMDVDDKGHIVVGGTTSDSGLLLKTVTQNLPFAAYIAKGNYYAWAKFFEATDGSAGNTNQYSQVLDITFRYDGERSAVALDRANSYDMSYMIVVLNKDGSLYSAFRENTANARGKVNITGMLFDQSNFITLGLDFSPDGNDLKRQAVLTRFNTGNIASPTFSTQFYLVGGSSTTNVISQVFALQRIRTDSSNIYASGIITDSTGIRRVFLGKSAVSNGAMTRYYMYTPGGTYNTDKNVAVIRRMSLYENELTTQHILSTCMMSYDGYRIHFGQFVFTGAAGTSAPIVMTPTPEASNNRYFCLGMYQKELGLAYTLYNDRRDNNPSNYKLILGKVSYTNSKVEILNVANHFGTNNYFGAKFIHMMRFYYWGQSKQLYGKPSSTFTYSKYAGFLNIFDPQETAFSCNPSSQTFTFPTTGFLTLTAVVAPLIDWKISTGLTTTTGFANSVIKQIRVVQSSSNFVMSNLNLKEPLTNNTWCPITTKVAPPTLTAPDIEDQMFSYNPDTLASQVQSFRFDPIQVSRVCPDVVLYNLTYLTSTNGPLPSFIKFMPENNSYVFEVSTTDHVGTYEMVLYSTLGNNMTTFDRFTSQVASPCLGNLVQIQAPSQTPVYDISLWQPMYIDLNWLVSNMTPSCGSLYFNFKMINGSDLGEIQPNIFSIENTTSGPGTGLQRLKIWTQEISSAKLWDDLMIEAKLQGDLVATYVYSIQITNDCGVTSITSQAMPNWTYYTGRDAIDLTFVWSETVGKCGPISYKIHEYLSTNPSSNNTLDSSIFTYPSVPGTNNTLKAFTADETKVGTYKIRVYASLGVGGYKQSSTIFQFEIIRDPCAYYGFTKPEIEDLTLWINQTDQTVQIPYFKMNGDPVWICNFTYVFTNGAGGVLDPIFKKTEVVAQGTGPSVQLDTIDVTKVDLSPYTIKLKGWPTRSPSTVAQTLSFRVFIAYLDKTDCPTGKYYRTSTETCEPCQSPCTACKNSPTTCTWCEDDKMIVNDGVSFSCISKSSNCPAGTIKDPYLNLCKKCSDFCKSCTNSNTCQECIPNYSLAAGKCFPFRECPSGYMFNGSACAQCPSNCQSCQSGSKCTYCNQDYYLNTQTGLCVQTCPNGYYEDRQSRVCMVCAPQCATCENNNYTCTSCRDLSTPQGPVYMYLFGEKCVDRCPYLRYYQNFNNRSCDQCNSACEICVNAINDCIVCNNNSVISGRECLNSCPEKNYITQVGTCFDCDPQCQNCTGPMNSQCQKCVNQSYLTGSTCEKTCNPPLYPDNVSGLCTICPYYCNQCSDPDTCQRCKSGFIQRPNQCEGENFLRITPTTYMTVPINPALTELNSREMTTEIWFKIDTVLSSITEIILGTFPYKIRKKANVAQVQLNFNRLKNYCDTFNLKGGEWYHYAYSISVDLSLLACYVNGEKISIGTTMSSFITAEIVKFDEITFGYSTQAENSESKFTGYVREFRWWNVTRSQFQIKNFMEISFSNAPVQMIAYWKLNEDRKNETEFKDSKNISLTYNPMSNVANPKHLKDVVEMREVYLKLCPEGTYGEFNDTAGVQECYKCDPSCKNCNGNTNTSCTDCYQDFRLIEAEQKCMLIRDCPLGYYQDLKEKCQPCHEYCISCIGSPTFCPVCKPKYFKLINECSESCPRGLYGDYETQSCQKNPFVSSLYPNDSSKFEYGTFIDLFATFETFNNEPLSKYTYGWIIKNMEGEEVDLAKDAAKPYFGTDITRVHLDNNIIQPNFYYNITFYVKGKDAFYNGMLGSMYNVIYIGIPPRKGKCKIDPPQGIATVTQFAISCIEWVEREGMAEYGHYYSYDDGKTFIPLYNDNLRNGTISVTFEAVFKTINVQLKCTAKNVQGFSASAYSSFILMKRSSSNAVTELSKFDISKVANEMQTVSKQSRIVLMAQEIGQIKKQSETMFDPKVLPDQCTNAMCSYSGECKYDQFVKKYYCDCSPGRGGFNCTFKNVTQLLIMKNYTLDLAKKYQPLSLSGRRTYDYEFLNLVTSSKDLMSDDTFDAIQAIVSNQVTRMVSQQTFTVGDNSDAQKYLQIVSNMIEYLQDLSFKMNMTNAWANVSDPVAKKTELANKLEGMINMTQQIRGCTRNRLSFLQTEISFQSRMLSYRQILTKAESIMTIPATSNMKKSQQTYVKLSPANFANNTGINLGKEFVAETIEYAVNPYQLDNTDNIAVNVFEVNLYNYSKTVTETFSHKLDIQNLTSPIEFAFPISENQNLTEFSIAYNQLSPFKYNEKMKKKEMIDKSNLSCVFWNVTGKAWSNYGCKLMSLDKTHIKCNCSHLSAFTVQFVTPKLTIDAPLLENSTVKAKSQQAKTLTLKDIIKWPLDKYLENMYELWQHNRPSFISFIIKPGCAVLGLFWAMYLSSLIYYSGRDDLRRFKMTKQQNRDDLAELQDNDVQNVNRVIKDLIVQDFLHDNGKYIQKQSKKMVSNSLSKKQIQPPKIKIYEQLSKDEQKAYKKRARKKVFGIPAGLCARARRIYDNTMSHNTKNPNAKMSFFNEELKNNLWIGLIAKTSKIAPRHVRLLLMYFYASLYITGITIIFAFEIQEMITENALFQVVALAVFMIPSVWIITIPVALIFRMPLELRKMVAGVKTKKVNKAFRELDVHMGWRYAIGYFICLSTYFIMSVCVIVFNIFYPHNYVIGWAFVIILLYILDLIFFTFALAGLQMVNIIISTKIKCWYNVWAAIEVFRYVKNLRG